MMSDNEKQLKRKHITMHELHRKIRRTRWLVLFCAMPVLYGIGFVAFRIWNPPRKAFSLLAVTFMDDGNPFNDLRFDRNTWLNRLQSTNVDNPRGRMAEDVTKRHIRAGMTKKQVVVVLGEPDDKIEENYTNVYTYWLGSWAGFGMDPDILVIEFNHQGRVAGAIIQGS